MSPERRRIPDYLLERAAGGDLPAEERAALLDALAREPGGDDRLAALARDDADTLARVPPKAFAAQVAERAGKGRAGIGWLLAPAATAALALVFASTWSPRAPVEPVEPAEVTRVKGLEPHLVVHRDAAGVEARLQSGASARPGDVLQLGYVSAGRSFGVIVSIDGRGATTLHWPLEGGAAGALAAQREALLPQSFRLDDAPGFERFLLVTSDAPFPVDAVLRAAGALAARPDASRAPLTLDRRLTVSSTLILKEVR
jgi:hypothetical protein